MKKMIALLLMMLLPASALAFDTEELYRTENTTVFEQPGGVDTVVRMLNQPFLGELEDDGSLAVFVDYIEKVDLDATLIRVMASISVFDPMQADTVAFTLGKTTYAFTAECEQFEYDGIYMEDYTFCLTGESLAFLKALAQQRKDTPIPVTFSRLGETMLTGSVVLPGEELARIYDRYIDLGGKRQELAQFDDMWPCEISKAK